MRDNTQFQKFDAGRPRNNPFNVTRKRNPSDLSTNYKIALQLYCINKEQASKKKELKYAKSPSAIPGVVISKPSSPIISTIVSFLTVTFSSGKKVRQEMSLITE